MMTGGAQGAFASFLLDLASPAVTSDSGAAAAPAGDGAVHTAARGSRDVAPDRELGGERDPEPLPDLDERHAPGAQRHACLLDVRRDYGRVRSSDRAARSR